MQAFEERYSPKRSQGEQNIQFHSERVSKKLEKTNLVIYLLILVLFTALLLVGLIMTLLPPKNQIPQSCNPSSFWPNFEFLDEEKHTCQ